MMFKVIVMQVKCSHCPTKKENGGKRK